LALPALLYGSENWTITTRDARRMTAAEIKYTRKTAGCTSTDYKTNTDTAKELNITPVLEKIQQYRKNTVYSRIESAPFLQFQRAKKSDAD